jgi:hypothetical protein
MMSDGMDHLGDDRLKRLELEVERLSGLVKRARNEVRALQWLLVGVSVLATGAMVVMHDAGLLSVRGLTSSVAKTLETKEFGLYNRDGNRVLLADYDKFGYPNLVFMNLQKHYKMGIKVWPEGGGTPGLVFYDGTGIRGNLRMDDDNASVLNLMGSDKKGKITLAVSKDGDPSLVVKDKEGKVIFEVPAGTSKARDAEAQSTRERNNHSNVRPDRVH